MKVVSSSFSSAFDKMLSEHIRFNKLLQTFWNEMVRGWGQMGLKIVADYVQNLAKIVIQHALSALKIQVIDNNAMTIGKASKLVWESFLDLLGIKRVTKVVTEEGSKAAAIKAAQAQSTEIMAQADTTQGIDRAVTDTAEVISSAATAAAIAAEAAAAGGPAAMTAAAEEASAVVFAVGAGASVFALRGGILDKDALVQAHATEMILPPPISMGLQNVIKHGSISAPQALGASPGAANTNSGASTGKTITHSHRWNIDARGGNEKQIMALFDKKLIPKVKRAFRNGAFDK
jgi:hypothetical protein